MDTTVVVALITAGAAVFTAVFGSIAAAKLRRQEREREREDRERDRQAAEDAEEARRRDALLTHYRDLVHELQADNNRLRAALRREEAPPGDS